MSRLLRVICAPALVPAFALAAALTLGATAQTAYAQAADIVRGRVVSDSGKVIAGAAVTITRGPDRLVQTTTSDSTGRYSITFDPGTGDYLVHVAFTGYRSARRRVQRISSERELVADFTLALDLTVLEKVVTTASRPVRASERVGPTTTEAGASEQWKAGVDGQVLPGSAGDINAMAGTIPGMTMTAAGPVMLGASAESNLTTLNGMAMAGGSLPRAANTEMRVSGATFDATRGGFSGANIDVRLGRGNRSYQTRRSFFTFDAPALQLTDPIGRSMGLRNQGLRASVGADGEAIRHILVYNVSAEVRRNSSTPATLTSLDAHLMRQAGVAPEAASALLTGAEASGIPLTGNGAPTLRATDGITLLGRFDDVRDSLRTLTLTTYLSADRQGALGYGPLTAPASGGKSSQNTIGAQFLHAQYVGKSHNGLMYNRMGISRSASAMEPYSRIPSARVLVQSATATTPEDLASLTLGGNQGFDADDSRWTAEASNELIWMARGSKHRFKSQLWFRADGLNQNATTNQLGSYSYSSLDDFLNNKPASYSRTIQQPERSATTLNGAAALAHQWTPSRWFNMIYGARVEANSFATAPPVNSALENALNVETGVAPSRLHISPRVGFTWTYNRERENGNFSQMNSVGTFYRPTLGFVRGGIGEFRDIYKPSMLADAVGSTGLPGSTLYLSCIGAAVPIPDWNDMNSGTWSPPNACTDGSGVLGERAPSVALLDPGFDAPRSWRATLGWESRFGALRTRLDALGSYDLSQPGTVDANFSGMQRFTLEGEGNRPVFVSPASIDAASGAVSPVEARTSDAFGRVAMRTSDLKGYGGQLTATIQPDVLRSSRRWSLYSSLSYTLQRTLRQYRGFDGAGFGDPRDIEWATGASDVRHAFVLQGGVAVPKLGSITLYSRVQSGMPYTPVVQGDVNGDGRGGDRAFIPGVQSGDPELSSAISSLIESAPAGVRSCLEAQRGSVAGRNSCRGPWTQQLHATWRPRLPRAVAMRGLSMNVVFENPLAGLDQLFNGSDNMKGWGAQSVPDPVLLIPRGFDAQQQKFRYDVNPRFGDTRAFRTLSRSPFRVTLDFSYDFSTRYDVQKMRRALEPMKVDGQWEPRSADSIMVYYMTQTSSIYRAALAQSDSIFLTNSQQDALIRADSIFGDSVRALHRPLGEFLATQRDGAGQAALDSAATVEKNYWELFWSQIDIIVPILTPQQVALLPFVRDMSMVSAEDRLRSKWFIGYPVPAVYTRPVINR